MSDLPIVPGGRFGPATPGSLALWQQPFQPAPAPTPSRPSTRRWVLMTVGALVVAAGIGYGCYQWGSGSVTVPAHEAVVVTTRPLAAGAPITAQDLGSQVIEPPKKSRLTALPATAGSAVVGKVAAHSLPAGTILAGSDVALPGSVPTGGQALIGLSLKPSEVPVGGLSVGERVGIIYVPAGVNGGPPPAPLPITAAPVWNIVTNSDGSVSCDVTVADTLAVSLSAASAKDELALVRLSPTAQFPPPAR